MAIAIANVSADELMKGITLSIKLNVSKGFKLRIFCATTLIRFAGLILGCRIDVEENKS